ncbi:class I histocompatibility antigen, Gogo-C*0203 alpha chain-like isoform X2 [Erythrolamprus reginae]|uniref:class I histocompatibility antigen, Gogo-C*0203 alpha chain-like isoform X2 n=1 Tax=Erythrolamprus reginae TaxID=121349 RepID=UPI00396C77BD
MVVLQLPPLLLLWTVLENLVPVGRCGLHTWQVDLGCELREGGSKMGFLHFGYDGMDFIRFDKETLRWVAAHPKAEKVKETWEDDPRRSQRNKFFLEETCIEWLQKYLSYQKVALKTEPPVGKVTHKVVHDKLEVLICQAFGFYPKEIQSIWTRDGEACKYETFHRNVAPNSGGTYYVQLSIQINPKERDHFRCHLEHEGLQDPLVLAFKGEADIPFVSVGVWIIIILASANLFLICYGLECRKNLHQAMTNCFDHLTSEILCSSPTSGTDDENHLATILPPKMTSEDCCGQKTELRGREKTPLLAYPNACSDHEEGPSLETSERGLEEHLEDAEAIKPGMEELEEEMSRGTSQGPQRSNRMSMAGEEIGEMQLHLEDSQTQPEAQDGEGLQLQLIRRDEKTELGETQWMSVRLFHQKEPLSSSYCNEPRCYSTDSPGSIYTACSC